MSEELRKGEFSESERRENFLEVKERVIPPPGSVAGGYKEGGRICSYQMFRNPQREASVSSENENKREREKTREKGKGQRDGSGVGGREIHSRGGSKTMQERDIDTQRTQTQMDGDKISQNCRQEEGQIPRELKLLVALSSPPAEGAWGLMPRSLGVQSPLLPSKLIRWGYFYPVS